jgi:hypothetical protein
LRRRPRRLQAVEVGSEVVGGGEAKDVAGLAWLGSRGGFAKHGGGVETKAEVGAALPVAKVVAGLVAGASEIGDFVLRQTYAVEGIDCVLVHACDGVVGGDDVGVVASAAGEEFATKAGLVVDFEHVDAGMGNARARESGDRFLPRGEGLAGQARDEVEVDVGDSSSAEAAEVLEDHGAIMEAAGLAGFPVDEGLNSKADAIYADTDEGGKRRV